MSAATRRKLLPGLMLLVVAGVASFGFALARGPALRAWEAFLVNLLFWLGIASLFRARQRPPSG